MATTVACDLCGEVALGKVRAVVEVEGAIPGFTKTGRMEELDCCEACRGRGLQEVYRRAISILEAHVPAQIELLALKDEILALRNERTEHQNHIGMLEPPVKHGAPEEDDPEFAGKRAAHARLKESLELRQGRVAEIDEALRIRLERRAELIERTK